MKKKIVNNFQTKDLFSYMDNIYKKENLPWLLDKKVRKAMNKLINKASKITNLEQSELLSQIDFKPNDLTIEALEGLLAILRAILWLEDFNFTNIEPIKKIDIKQTPDFSAFYKPNIKCAVEVFCLTNKYEQQKDSCLDVYVNADPEFDGSKFYKDFIAKAHSKKKQLDSVESVEKKILLCVVNPTPLVNLNDISDWNKHAQFLYEKLKWGNNYHIGFLTGALINGKLCDVIYPKLS